MTVPSSLEPIRVSLEPRAYIQIIQCQGFVGTTMIGAILVALESSLNLVGAVCYNNFIIAISPTSSEQGGEVANLILMLLFLVVS